MTTENNRREIFAVAVGAPEFTRRLTSQHPGAHVALRIVEATASNAWSTVLTHRPRLLILEIGPRHNDREHRWVRTFLEQVRGRFEREVFIALVITGAERLFYAGDLLFNDDATLAASGLVDTFLVSQPAFIPNLPGIGAQLENLANCLGRELDRRELGGAPLPALNAAGWVNSLGDPESRELWMRWLPRAARYTNESILIIGETGTGKSNLARAIHELSGRTGQFVSITPRDFSSSELMQAELFGSVAGAFTGAVDKWGLVQSAARGTLFIDELQSIDRDLQGKLITFIENKAYRRVGSAERIEADVRFVFATNQSLLTMIDGGTLRDDFAYRVERLTLDLNPLRDRKLDIPAALGFALAKVHRQRGHSGPVTGFSPKVFRLLLSYPWPGNLRQLENHIARLVEYTNSIGGTLVDEGAIAASVRGRASDFVLNAEQILAHAASRLAASLLAEPVESVADGMRRFADLVMAAALEQSGGDVALAAESVGENPDFLSAAATKRLLDSDPRFTA